MIMTTIHLMTTDQVLTVTDQPELASGDQNSVLLRVEVDTMWDGYTLSAVFFTDGDETVYEQLLANNECIIPHEVLASDGNLYIGIRGVDADNNRVKTSTLIKYKVEKGAPSGTAISVPPTADVYQQLLKLSNDTREIAQSVRDDFEAGAIPALQEQNKKEGFMFWVGTKAEYEAQKDTISKNTFCVITDDTTEADILKVIDQMSGVELQAPIQHDPSEFDYFIGYIESGGYTKKITFNRIDIDSNLNVYAYAFVPAVLGGTITPEQYAIHKLHFYWGDGGYMLDTTFTAYDIASKTQNTSTSNFNRIVGYKTPIKGE